MARAETTIVEIRQARCRTYAGVAGLIGLRGNGGRTGGGIDHPDGGALDVTSGVRPRPHGAWIAGDRILTNTVGAGGSTGAFPAAISGAGGRSRGHM